MNGSVRIQKMIRLTKLGFGLTAVLLLFSCGQSSDSDDNPGSPQEETTTVPGAGKVNLWTRTEGYNAAVFLPATYESGSSSTYPMVLSLHGFNGSVLNGDQTAVGGERSGFIKQVWDTPLSATYPAVVIAPHVYSQDNEENSLWSHDELRELILDAIATYQINPKRIVVTGYSAGSIAAQELSLRSEDLIAGIMPGAFRPILQIDPCAVEDLPVWTFGNNSDPLFQPASWREVKEEVESCGNSTQDFQLVVYENTCGHGCWDEHWSRPEVRAWLINQQLGF